MIDLHSHTDESDGTFTPAELITEARRIRLEALAVTDHDTLRGAEAAAPIAAAAGLDFVCGIELSTKHNSRSVHLLGYFLNGGPSEEFRSWVNWLQATRRERNRRLIERLRSLNVDITLEEVEARGRSLTGRPHFARVLLAKGYVKSIQHAFDEYLDSSAKAYVDRNEPALVEAIGRLNASGGLPSLAHPVRLMHKENLPRLLSELKDAGLRAVETYHSDHDAAHTREFLELAKQLGLAVTGGSDFHGDNKPQIRLGTGHNGNLKIPGSVLQRLREAA